MVVGFDLWGTLIKSSPLFAEAKKTLFKKHFPCSVEDCEQAMSDTKKEFDLMASNYGFQPDSDFLMKAFLSKMVGVDTYDKKLADAFWLDYQNLAMIFLPDYFSSETKEYYNKITSEKVDIVAVSNTLFLGRAVMEKYLLKMFPIMGSYYFSCDAGFAKPDPRIVRYKMDLFVGNDPVTDAGYAKNNGIQFLQINSNNKTIKDVYEHIVNNKK